MILFCRILFNTMSHTKSGKDGRALVTSVCNITQREMSLMQTQISTALHASFSRYKPLSRQYTPTVCSLRSARSNKASETNALGSSGSGEDFTSTVAKTARVERSKSRDRYRGDIEGGNVMVSGRGSNARVIRKPIVGRKLDL